MAQPAWWKDSTAPLWEEARVEVLASWDRVVGVPKVSDREATELAMAFGFFARQAFEPADGLKGDVERRLREDWATAHPNLPWERVSGAIQHGWDMSPEGGWLPPIAAPTERLAKA